MKKIRCPSLLLIGFLCCLLLCACSAAETPLAAATPSPTPRSNPSPHASATPSPLPQEVPMKKEPAVLHLTFGTHQFTATLADTPAAQAFRDLLPLTLEMGDLNSNEKYYSLASPLPSKGKVVGNIRSGDIMLYGSDCLVLFYKAFATAYPYTILGTVDDPTALAAALGPDTVTVTWSLAT